MFCQLFIVFPLILTSCMGAQDAALIEVPAAAPANFSQVVGDKYRIFSSAMPTEVLIEEPITLKVRIEGQGPEKYHPQRKNLQLFPENFSDDFHLEAVPSQDVSHPEKGYWEFVYRLRPKRRDIAEVPALKLTFFAPATKKFQSSYTDEIPIKVDRPPETTADKMDLKIVKAPERFYHLRPMAEVLRDDSPMPVPGPFILAAFLAVPPLVCFSWYWAWRHLYPNAAQQRQRRRSRAARRAIALLEKPGDDIFRTRTTAVDYLRDRLDLPAVEPTPFEVACYLKRLGLAKALIADWNTFLKTCDRLRFAPSETKTGNRLNAEAIRLVHAVEVYPCVGR